MTEAAQLPDISLHDGVAAQPTIVVLDFGSMPFPVLEGQSIGIVPPGVDDRGRAHVARQYSVASPRNGERPGYNNVSLTVKRVTEDHQGKPVRGVASNYVCDLKVGDAVQVVGPFGSSFLMPNHPRSHIVMICTGTGSAPMRAMTEWRRRLRNSGKFEGGKLLLFFGARTQQELPYFGPLQSLQPDLFVVPDEGTGEPRSWTDVRNLLLVVEGISPATARNDRGKKRVVYQKAGIPQYWILDPDSRLVERWQPDDERPEVITDILEWYPRPEIPPLLITLPYIFGPEK